MAEDNNKYLSMQDELEIADAVQQLSESILTESETKQLDESFIYDQLMKIRDSLTNPKDLDDFIKKHEAEIKKIEAEPASEKKSVLLKAWECLKYALAKGFSFIAKHWKKIILAVLVIAAILTFKQIGPGTGFGLNLFSKAKNAVQAAKSFIFPGGSKKLVDWIPVDSDDIDDVVVKYGDDIKKYQSNLKSTGEMVLGINSDPNDESSPIRWFKQAK